MTIDLARVRRNLRQFIKFGVVGGSGVLVNMGVGIIMHRLNGGTINAGEPLVMFGEDMAFRFRNLVWITSFLVANLSNYQLNRIWTFKGHTVSWWRGFWPFLVTGSVAMLAGLVIQWALTHQGTPFYLASDWFTEDVGLRSREYWAQIIAILFTMPINFVVNKLWTFGKTGGERPVKQVADSGTNASLSVTG
ncbi:MAG TPA: GtrA family protein [Actinomycetaceae bacterium]|nr:GtrA family protein [Actinomycetaceae bacterium]